MALILCGKVNSAAFQKAKAAVEGSTAASAATVKSLLPVDYEAELVTLKKELGGKLWQHTGDVLALTSGGIDKRACLTIGLCLAAFRSTL